MNDKIAENLGLLLRNKSPDTRRQYLYYIEEFLKFAGTEGPYDEWTIRRFSESLEKKGYSASYVSVAFWAVKLLLKAQNQALKITLGELLPKEEKKRQPTMEMEDVRRLIGAVKLREMQLQKALLGQPDNKQLGMALRTTRLQKVLLALSSTYGLRQSELGAVSQEDLNLLERTILIRTKKGGRTRRHYLPDEILPIVGNFSFDGALHPTTLNIIFKQICALAGVKREKREVWHSIRRRLLVELINARLPDEVVYSFMRWKRREMPMISVYYNPKDEDVDRQVFAVHPFVGEWR